MGIIAPNEEARIENLKRYKILYTKSEPIFDQLAAITATMLNTPLAMINFVDRYKVWTKSEQHNENSEETHCDRSMCALAVLNESAPAFETFTNEIRLMLNPLAAGEYGLKFYAATPITTDEGFNVGSVCVVDKAPHHFGDEEREKLDWVSAMVRIEMNKRIAMFSVA